MMSYSAVTSASPVNINESKIDANRTYDAKNIDSYIYKITNKISELKDGDTMLY